MKKFKYQECKEMSTPMNSNQKFCKEGRTKMIDLAYFRSLVGCLMYLKTNRLDTLNVRSILSRFMHCARE